MTPSQILVVEDDARLAATLERVLAAEGHGVMLAGDGMDALRRARDRPPDLVILDLMLPGLDGIGVCRRLRTTGQFPILILTALGGTEERVRGLDSGADDYLVKPFAYQESCSRACVPSFAAPRPRTICASPTSSSNRRVAAPGVENGRWR